MKAFGNSAWPYDWELISDFNNDIVMSVAANKNGELYAATIDRGVYSYHNTPLPVELGSFYSENIFQGVNLKWVTTSETNNYGFEIFRDGEKICFIPGKGSTNELTRYSYSDHLGKNGNYNYKLVQIDFDGKINEIGKSL